MQTRRRTGPWRRPPAAGGPREERELLARFAAYLWGSGGTLTLVTLLLPHPAHAFLPALVVADILAFGMLALLATAGSRLPYWVFRAASVAGTLIISVAAYFSHEGAPAYALLYFWVALYVFYFLPLVDAVLQIVLIAAGYALVLATAGPFSVELTLWVMTVGSVLVAALWVRSVVRRLRRHADGLARANRDLEELAYVSAHDLQEPLRMVASYVQLLERRYRGRLDQDADDFIGFAVEGATRMKTLINDLMAYSSVSRAEHEVGPVELRECVRAAMDRISSVIRSSEARVVCPEELPVVEGDRAQLTLLVENLLSNAIKFHGEARPEVRITAEQGEGEWVVSVRDNGMGIAPQQHERIFAVFQRLNPREHFPGNGIGLAICRRILERHGGRIWVESEPGRGSTFRFTLPLGVAVAAAGRRHTARL